MYDMDDVRLFMKAAIEQERHGTLPTDTQMELNGLACCEACAQEAITTALQEAI